MRLLSRMAKSVFGKAALAAVVLGVLMTFLPSSASAAPAYVYGRPGVVVRGGFYGHRVFAGPRAYYGPVYGPVYSYGPVYVPHRYWDARFHCWRYR